MGGKNLDKLEKLYRDSKGEYEIQVWNNGRVVMKSPTAGNNLDHSLSNVVLKPGVASGYEDEAKAVRKAAKAGGAHINNISMTTWIEYDVEGAKRNASQQSNTAIGGKEPLKALVDEITADDTDGDIRQARYQAGDGLVGLESIVNALRKANYGPEANQLQKKIDALMNDPVFAAIGKYL